VRQFLLSLWLLFALVVSAGPGITIDYLLGWDPNPPSDNVILYRMYEEFAGGGSATVGFAKETQFLVAGLDPGTTHFYVVTAIDVNNLESPPSNEVEIDVPPFMGEWQPPPIKRHLGYRIK
jgi:hypothetical protein